MTEAAQANPLNKVLGTWRMVSAQLDPNGRNLPAYGPAPSSLLVFTSDMHVIEVMTNSTVPKFVVQCARPRHGGRKPGGDGGEHRLVRHIHSG